MTYYDPLLGLWGLVPGGRALARADQRVWTTMNAMFATAYGDAGVTVADVAATFQVDDFTDTVVVPGRVELPMNVANTCRWTWFCSPRFAAACHEPAAIERSRKRSNRSLSHSYMGTLVTGRMFASSRSWSPSCD